MHLFFLSSVLYYAGGYPGSVSLAACKLYVNRSKEKIKLKEMKTNYVNSFGPWLSKRLGSSVFSSVQCNNSCLLNNYTEDHLRKCPGEGFENCRLSMVLLQLLLEKQWATALRCNSKKITTTFILYIFWVKLGKYRKCNYSLFINNFYVWLTQSSWDGQ